MGKVKQIDFSGKCVFVGIDVHKKTYAIVAVCEGVVVETCTLAACAETLHKTLTARFGGATLKLVYEAGFAGFSLYRFFERRGIECLVVDPASILVQSNNLVKTDRRDARAMAQQLAAGMLRGVYVPSLEAELDRAVERAREALVRDRTRISNRLKSKLYQFGYPVEELPLSLEMIKRIKGGEYPPLLRELLLGLIDQFLDLSRRIKEVEQRLAAQAAKDPQEAILRSVPGIGKVTSRVVAAELIDIKRFSSGKKLAAFCGLTPREHSSGEHIRRGGITKQGSPILRRCLIEASWVAIRKDASLKRRYEELKKGRGGRKAIVAVARALILRIRACLLANEPYRIPA